MSCFPFSARTAYASLAGTVASLFVGLLGLTIFADMVEGQSPTMQPVPLAEAEPVWETGSHSVVLGDTVTVEHFQSIPLTALSSGIVLFTLPQFDPALGELVRVQVCQRVFGRHDLWIKSFDPLPREYEASVQSQVDMFGPPSGEGMLELLSTLSQETTLGPVTLAFKETAAVRSNTLEDAAETPIGMDAWARYIGTDGVQFRLELRAVGMWNGSGNAAYQLAALTGLRASVVYEYVPAGGAE